METFDVKTCQRKLAEHYRKKAKVPTTVWTSKFQVDLDEIYTRLSWVKQEQTTTGSSQTELNHYTEILTEKTKNEVAKRILVQGETGIGKTTFVKKMLLDWSNLEEAKIDEERKDALRKFDVVVSINLKEVSKCQTFKEVLYQSRVFPDDETSSLDDLHSYIRENQDKVLLVFDGYDEYRTGSLAEETYGGRRNSPIFEIFQGNSLRDCTVLVTTRPSRADELHECADIHAKITGFNWDDREAFMIKFLDGETEANSLHCFLLVRDMEDLARVPLLNLFFCLLWKEQKETLEEGLKSKTELFQGILEHILQHSHKRHSPSNVSKLRVANYNEILAEIGKVALEGLLRGDLLFKFGQLPEKVRGEESVVVGLLQVSEFGPSVEPKEMVSFIHKSIQEYLAAWFVTYSCVPEGNLGGIEQHARTVEDCESLENVFHFVSGLSDKGAEKVFEHFLSVTTRNLSMTMHNADNETDAPLHDLTEEHWQFSDLAFNCFREVKSKTELLSGFLDCFGEIVPVPNEVLLSQFMPNVESVSTLAHSRTFAFRFHPHNEHSSWMSSMLLKKFLKCILGFLRVTENTEVNKVGDFLEKCRSISERGDDWHSKCSFHFVLRFRNGQLQFYITNLVLHCGDHARLFTETTAISVPSVAANLSLEEFVLKFTRSLQWRLKVSGETMRGLGTVVRDCRHLNCIDVAATKELKPRNGILIRDNEDSVCHLLEQVPNPSKCSLKLGSFTGCTISYLKNFYAVRLTSAGAERLASLLPRFNNVSVLNLTLVDTEVDARITDALITSLSRSCLKILRLSGITLTPAAATTLGRSLPEMSSLECLELIGVKGQIVRSKEIEALFGQFYKTLALNTLTFRGFTMEACLPVLVKSFLFFPSLEELYVGKFSMDEHNLWGLLESLSFIPCLRVLKVQGKRLKYKHSCRAQLNSASHSFAHETLENLVLSGISLNPTAAAALGRSLADIPSLRRLELSGMGRKTLQGEELEALFGGLNKTVSSLPSSQRLFPNSCDRRPNYEHSCRAQLNTVSRSVAYVTLDELVLSGISLNPTAAVGLSRALADLPSLRRLELNGILQGEELEALFGGLNKTVPLLPSSQCLSPNSCDQRSNYDHSCRAQLNTVSRSVAFVTLKELVLSGVSLNPTAAAALGRSLADIPSLGRLELSGMDRKMLQGEEMKALFGALNKTVPLLSSSHCFFPKLYELHLGKLNMDAQHLFGLMESVRFIPNLVGLCVEGKRPCTTDTSSTEVNTVFSFTHETLKRLTLKGISLTPTVAAMLGRSLPKLSSLTALELTGVDGSVVTVEQMDMLFDGFSETLPLERLNFNGFNVRGCLAPLTRRFSSFPNLGSLELSNLNMDEHDLRGLLESFQFIPKLSTLDLSDNPLGHAVTSIVPHVINLPRLEFVWLDFERSCSKEDWNSLAQALPDRVNLLRPCSFVF